MDTGKDSRLLWETLLRMKEPALTVFDAQTELLADAGLNENIGTDVEKWSQAYLTPARRLGIATVMIDHTGHTEGGRAVASRQKGAAAKIELCVSKDEKFGRNKIGRTTIKVTKNTVSAPFPRHRHSRSAARTASLSLRASRPAPTRKLSRRGRLSSGSGMKLSKCLRPLTVRSIRPRLSRW